MYCVKSLSPDEERGGDQHHGQVHRHGRLEVERFEEGGGVGDEQQEEGGEVGGQQLVHQPSLEHYLHLQTTGWGTCNHIATWAWVLCASNENTS